MRCLFQILLVRGTAGVTFATSAGKSRVQVIVEGLESDGFVKNANTIINMHAHLNNNSNIFS